MTLTASSAAGSDVQVLTDYITIPEPGALLQLATGCVGLLMVGARRRERSS